MMERKVWVLAVLWLILVLVRQSLWLVSGNMEGDALHSLRNNLNDPNNVLQSWDPTLVNPCTWFHVTCNNDNSVIRVDLGNAALSGQLVPQLGLLKNLQYLELYSNNISGPIPSDLGNLTSLVSLDLYVNSFIGPIPDTLGKLSKLRFLRLNNNSLTGPIPMSLTNISALRVLDLSNNRLSGVVPENGSFSLFTPISFANNLDLCGPVTGHPCPGSPPFSPPPPFVPPPPISSPGNEEEDFSVVDSKGRMFRHAFKICSVNSIRRVYVPIGGNEGNNNTMFSISCVDVDDYRLCSHQTFSFSFTSIFRGYCRLHI